MPRRGQRGRAAGLLWALGAYLLWAPAAFCGSDRSSQTTVELKLPADIVYVKGISPDSAVVFSHQTHFGYAENRCVGCHPKPFLMLKPSRRVSHREMNAGSSCGICHDGKHAFGARDSGSCGACHAGMQGSKPSANRDSVAGPGRLPKPLRFARGEASPGLVSFRHESHMKGHTCIVCHPKPFGRTAETRPGGAMHAVDACGACHDGAKAFGVEDAEACGRCHVESGGAR